MDRISLARPGERDGRPNGDGSQEPTTRTEEHKKLDKCFDLKLTTGESVRFEAHNAEIAQEWVKRLEDLAGYWKRRHRVDARLRMDVMALHRNHDPFAGTELGTGSDEILADIWDWCALKGCRPITQAGRLFMKKNRYDKYRLRYIVLAGGMVITFKIKKTQAFHQRKKRFSLFGAYVYSGMMAQDELHEAADQDALASHPKVYHDGLQSADGAEDTTFCIRLPVTLSNWSQRKAYQWEAEGDHVDVPSLSKKAPALLFFRARSALERDRWVWAINAEMERMVRSHVPQEEALRNFGKIPEG